MKTEIFLSQENECEQLTWEIRALHTLIRKAFVGDMAREIVDIDQRFIKLLTPSPTYERRRWYELLKKDILQVNDKKLTFILRNIEAISFSRRELLTITEANSRITYHSYYLLNMPINNLAGLLRLGCEYQDLTERYYSERKSIIDSKFVVDHPVPYITLALQFLFDMPILPANELANNTELVTYRMKHYYWLGYRRNSYDKDALLRLVRIQEKLRRGILEEKCRNHAEALMSLVALVTYMPSSMSDVHTALSYLTNWQTKNNLRVLCGTEVANDIHRLIKGD